LPDYFKAIPLKMLRCQLFIIFSAFPAHPALLAVYN
jgi:hypothetical protein